MKKSINKKIFKACAFIALFAMAFAPAIALAEIKLELNYPSLPGITDLASSTRSLPMALKYYVQLGVIIAILVCIVSLVWAGVSYISSTGQPGAMKQARERIFNTFLGLAILIGSFIILKTISPQMSLLSIKKPSIPTGGIVLLSKAGYASFTKGTSFGELVESGEIKVMGGDIANLELDFGKLKKIEYGSADSPDKEVNYEKFRLYAIGFYGEAAANYKVTLFSDINFNDLNNNDEALASGFQKIFSLGGRLKASNDELYDNSEDGKYFEPQKNGLGEDKMTIFVINGKEREGDGGDVYRNQAMWGSISYWLTDTTKTIGNENFPPQSIKIEGFANGVYLYAKQVISTGPPLVTKQVEKYFTASAPKLGDTSIDFDRKAEEIKIKNSTKMPDGTTQKNDYIAILHDGTDAEGNLSIFFQKRAKSQLVNMVPRVYYDVLFKGQEDLDISTENGNIMQGWNDTEKSFKFSPMTSELNGGSLFFDNFGRTNNDVIKVDVDASPEFQGIYGHLNKQAASSLSVYEISDDPTVCQEVRLYNKSGDSFLSFVPLSETVKPQENGFQLPMPFYRPVNLPNNLTGWMYNRQDDGSFKLEVVKDKSFNDTASRLEIRGKCLVVLFEKRVDYYGEATNQRLANLRFRAYKAPQLGDVSTGIKTVVLTNEGIVSGGARGVLSLSSTKAMSCTTGVNRYELWNQGKDSCVSGIVVFPIK